MHNNVSILLVEDFEGDTQLILSEVEKNGVKATISRVDTLETLVTALSKQRFDVVLADYSLSALSGMKALEIVREFDPELPFIIISSAMGEETAVEVMLAGAHDYLIKGNLARLVPAIQREIRESENRREKRRASEELAEAKAGLKALSNRMLEIQEEERCRIARGGTKIERRLQAGHGSHHAREAGQINVPRHSAR